MKNFFKLVWVYAKTILTLYGVQLIIFMLAFALMMIDNNIAQIIIGIAMTALLAAAFFFIAKGQAVREFKFRRINEVQMKKEGLNKLPLHLKARETSIPKAGITAAVFAALPLIFLIVGFFAKLPGMTAVVKILFAGALEFSIGADFGTNVGDNIIDKPAELLGLYIPVIIITAAAFFAGYAVGAIRRMQQHNEIRNEIKMLDEMGKT